MTAYTRAYGEADPLNFLSALCEGEWTCVHCGFRNSHFKWSAHGLLGSAYGWEKNDAVSMVFAWLSFASIRQQKRACNGFFFKLLFAYLLHSWLDAITPNDTLNPFVSKRSSACTWIHVLEFRCISTRLDWSSGNDNFILHYFTALRADAK